MDYEKLHKNTLASLQQMVSEGKITEEIARRICADFVKDSDDEKMIAWLIEYFYKVNDEISKDDRQKIIAWLEKQGKYANFRNKIQIGDKVTRNEDGVLVNLSQLQRVAKPAEKQSEQNSSNKVEPKFKVCDWIISNDELVHKEYHVCRIEKIEDDKYYLNNGDFLDKNTLEEYDYRLWTIQDAKDGDVLALSYASKNYIQIYKRLYEKGFKTIMSVYCFYCVEEDTYYDETDSFHVMNRGEIITPATKEQRDLLFQKMKEAGYKWNSERKELKKIEQKLFWSEEDEEMVVGLNNCLDELEEVNGWCYIYVNNKDVKLYKVRNWLKSIKERVGNFDDGYKVGFSAAKYNQWKPSNEQITALRRMKAAIAGEGEIYGPLNSLYEDLKKLKGE